MERFSYIFFPFFSGLLIQLKKEMKLQKSHRKTIKKKIYKKNKGGGETIHPSRDEKTCVQTPSPACTCFYLFPCCRTIVELLACCPSPPQWPETARAGAKSTLEPMTSPPFTPTPPFQMPTLNAVRVEDFDLM